MGHIFFSYSTKDVEYAAQLIDALKREGFDPWVDIEGLGVGTHWRTRLETQIETCDAYLLLVSRNSAKSKWVKEELDVAQDLGKPIFPIRIDKTEPFFGIRTIQYEDLRRGKLPTEEFYERLAMVTPRKKKKRRKVNRTNKAKRQVMEGTAELLSYYGEELSDKGKDFITFASKKSSELYKTVIASDAVKKLSASVKKNITPKKKTATPKKKRNTRKKKTVQKKKK